ncbi:alkaline ceramidase [Konateibacter massiliensis]|uniref:alkaline ceramidase n=1 Tax=Konateibacter massiliensis TaxID=2002841 RepID=UPI000C15A4EF|nr:alkaline ceramidase [Konateibacter massiliensis]
MATTCYAGAGKEIISIPEELLPLEGFAKKLDDLYARVFIYKAEAEWVLVSLEMTSLQDYEVEILKEKVGKILCVKKEAIWITVTHTFSAPHVRSAQAIQEEEVRIKNQLYCKAIEEAVEAASIKAMQSIREVTIGFGKGQCNINRNRDIETTKGWWLGKNPQGFSDMTLPVIIFTDKENNTVAVIYSYDMQSSVMDGVVLDGGIRVISSDVTGKASRVIEGDSDTVALYVLGAAADQMPRMKAIETTVIGEKLVETDHGEKGYKFVAELGEKLGKQVQNVMSLATYMEDGDMSRQKAVCQCMGQRLPKNMRELKATRNYDFLQEGMHEVPLEIIFIGEIAIVALQPEICSQTAYEIRKESPFSVTMVFTMVNGGAKYMADEKSYERITYEAMNSKFAKGSAEIVRDKILEMLKNKRRYEV